MKGIHIAIWSSLECNIAIICACVPALKGLASLIFPGLMGAKTQSSSLPGSGGSGTNSSRHGWGSRNDRGHNGANFGPEGKVIKMERSFEMRTVAVGDDNDSEKNLVTGPTATYHSHIYTGANERSPVPDTEICVMDKRLGRESL